MSEIKTPLRELRPGEQFTAGEDGAQVIDSIHTHSDIMRFIVADIGAGDARCILDMIEATAQP